MGDARLQEPGLVIRAGRVERDELHWTFGAFSQPHLRLDTVPPFLRFQKMTVLLPDLSYIYSEQPDVTGIARMRRTCGTLR